jgi:hypothetical protein
MKVMTGEWQGADHYADASVPGCAAELLESLIAKNAFHH